MTNILLTGSTRGIGAAIAAALDRPGVTVAGHGTRPGADATIAADLADPDAPALLWQAAIARLGHIDVLINNAGVFEPSPIDADDVAWRDRWARTVQVNLTAAADLSRRAVLHWRAQGRGGRIVTIASRAAYRGDSPDHWHYAASKAGMVAMTKTIARGYASEGILAFAICPGFVDTGMADGQAAADIPLGRIATPDEVAKVARFCALEAPASMTGAVIDVNGASYVR